MNEIMKDRGLSFEEFKKEVLNDYRIANVSRQCSLLGRKEVLTGKAKFGIFGDGKEVAQIALAKQFRDGDWRSGYYRDQTFMMAAGLLTAEQFFYSLYGETDAHLNPHNGGRSFNNHFSTANINEDGSWKNLVTQKNSSADISPTAGQMPRLVGLAYASKLFREIPDLHQFATLSDRGNEVAFGTIGDASTSEGHFWESINAAGVLEIPMAVSIWDDGFGISVPKKFQTTKQNISTLLKGFEKEEDGQGYLLYQLKAYDYAGLVKGFSEGISECRKNHIPVVFHVQDVTQPQGHSTSGSHERYKTPERLAWEVEFDCLKKMKTWMIDSGIATEQECIETEQSALEETRQARNIAWKTFTEPMRQEREALIKTIENRSCKCAREGIDKVDIVATELKRSLTPIRRENFSAAKKILRHVCLDCGIRQKLQTDLSEWLKRNYADNAKRYNSHLFLEKGKTIGSILPVPPVFSDDSPMVPGREILRDHWDIKLGNDPRIMIFGEDVGGIGGVNQTYEGLQKKYGINRVSDTGIRENTIMGQGIGLALRGLRPITEIQYFDYLLYALQTMSDDLATTQYRTAGQQVAPVIITTRGHRLEGIWHSGSPVSMVINSIRGIYLAMPRNMTQAAGIYNTLLEADEPALVVEPLNGYRLKERRPDNLGTYKIPLGVPEILIPGKDITLVTYGSNVRIAEEAVQQLKEFRIEVELIDVQTLMPFDIHQIILQSIKKTNRIIFFDEDVPGGATAYMMQKVVEEHGGYYYLDAPPKTLAAKEHRPAYSSDGDYFSKPNAEDIFEAVYAMMHEHNPGKFPKLY
jgi:2-oxoisovalerate dehydrogenase E1 component